MLSFAFQFLLDTFPCQSTFRQLLFANVLFWSILPPIYFYSLDLCSYLCSVPFNVLGMILFFVPDYRLILNISSRVTNLLPLLSSSLFSGFRRFFQKRSQLVIKCYANVAGDNQIQHPFLIHTLITRKSY